MSTPTPETSLARRWRLEINMGTEAVPDWQICPGITDFVPNTPPTLQASGEYENGGWGSNTKTAQTWQIVATFNRKKTADSTAYSPVHEKLRTAAFGWGADSKVEVRWFDREGLPEAYQGTGVVTWAPAGGDYTALGSVVATIDGDGPLELIANPLAGG
ncbi:phage tail tube protein [Streptomyces nanhaiensis]|uniref:phage tail tube protein n=1 Tax=Streptomyces nanhaiensis TaxID=679319 RepID=UPI00399CFB70